MNFYIIFFICFGAFAGVSFFALLAMYLRKSYLLRRIVPESNPTIITVKTKKIYSTEPYKYFTVEVFNNFAKGELTESLKEALMVHRVKQGRPFRFSAQLYNLSDSKFDLIKEYVVSLDDINNVSPSIIQKHHYVTQEFV